MIIILKQGSTMDQVAETEQALIELGYGVHPIYGVERTVIGAVGTPGSDKEEAASHLRGLEQVEEIVFVSKPYKFVAKEYKSEKTVIKVGDSLIGGDNVVIMAGPCTVESREMLLTTARAVKAAGATILRGGAYKPSTSPYSFQGMGEEGLKLLAEARDETDWP